jgi:TatD DNase family protein
MAQGLWTVDAHCHWSDARVFARAEAELPAQIERGVAGFLLGGVDPEEWRRQTALQSLFPGRVWRSFGLHPYFVASSSPAGLEAAFNELRDEAPRLEALGEMGLDFRKDYVACKSAQIEMLSRQLVLAAEVKKPVILHIVRAHEEALHELKDHRVEGMVHAFTANMKVAERYLQLGLHLSIGAKVLSPLTHDLAETVTNAPLERLLIESDCPDQPPPGLVAHDSTTVWAIAERIAMLKQLSLAAVVEQTRKNLFALIRKEIKP